jgi:hypothetical protein
MDEVAECQKKEIAKENRLGAVRSAADGTMPGSPRGHYESSTLAN